MVKAEKAGRYYALKLYSDDYLNRRGHSCQAMELFNRETELLQCIRHSRIPGCIDCFAYNNMYCLVQEYVPGDTLAALINQGRRFGEKEVGGVLLELLEILAFLHTPDAGKPAIVHRDLRLSNLIVRGNRLVLLDFGLACRIGHDADQAFLQKRLQSKSIRGVSPSYARMRNDLSVQSDLFGAGVVAVDLFTNSIAPGQSGAWEQQIQVSPPLKSFIRRLLGVEENFMSCSEALEYWRNI